MVVRPLLVAGLIAPFAATAVLSTGSAPASPAAAPAKPACRTEVAGGTTQPIYNFNNAVQQRVWIETPLDTDHNGEPDRVVADIARPRATETLGCTVPVVFEQSPYRKDVWGDVPYPSVLVDELSQNDLEHLGSRDDAFAATTTTHDRATPDLPGSLDDYYVPRGYAVVLGMSVGTADSDGCPTSGDQAETLGTKAIIDWLNGRAPGFDAKGKPVDAYWTNGDVGMTGVSYNGTLPNMVATTGVEGLKTIIPVSAISNWYEYYRANGLVRAPGTFQGEDLDILAQFTAGEARATGDCKDEIADLTEKQDRITGDYSPFWRQRDYLPDADQVRASVFVVHGINDWNVMTNNYAAWWDKLAGYGVPRKIWLHQGGHGGPGSGATYTLPNGQSWTYRQTENRWFDHWLWGIDNGIMSEPRAIVQRENRDYATYKDWPDPGARPVRLHLSADDATSPGGLSTEDSSTDVVQGFVDEGRTIGPAQLVAAPDTANPNRLVYRSPELADSARLSGRPSIRLRMAIENRNDANLTAYLVDYGAAGSDVAPFVVTRGWMDPQNRTGWDSTLAVEQGKMYDYTWTFEPKDYIFPAGHRIGVVVFSSDQEYTLLPRGGAELTVSPADSRVTLPIVGGAAALGF
ncbi:MAG TPA: Xaa-Pro dipeptidyl-peptidase [Nocardioidaceae bacterium]|nr:Xaa-Pro dipeptidyl-peptidase [Nocardioidaceae bacterium]